MSGADLALREAVAAAERYGERSRGTSSLGTNSALTRRRTKAALEAPSDPATLRRLQEEQEKKRQDDLDFERSVCVSVLTEKDFYDVLGSEWMKRPPTKIDLSDGRYKLETLTGPCGGILSPALKRHRLTELDVSDNRLHDIAVISKSNGFTALTCLMAKRNLIGSVMLQLPNLIELNLSHNKLTTLPPLDKISKVEVLMLSHNELKGSLEGLQQALSIKRLDLAYNQYDFNPSQLEKALQHLGRLKALQDLRLYSNPFVACFKEYQVFIVKALPHLRVLDDLDMTAYAELMRYDIKQSGIKELPVYDEAYRKRKEDEQYRQQDEKAENHSAAAFAHEGGLPRLKNIVSLLQEVIDDVSLLQKNVSMVHSIAKRRAQHLKLLSEMGDIFWEDLVQDDHGNVKDKSMCIPRDYEAAVSRTLELIVLVMERHDSVRATLIETLGWLTSVVKYSFGYKCLQRLARLMNSSSEDKGQVLHTVQTIVVPVIKNLSSNDNEGLKGRRPRELILGMGLLLQNPHHRTDVAKVLSNIIPMLLDWFVKSEKAQDLQDGDHVIDALARLTDVRENCLLVSDSKVARKCIAAINNQSYALSDKYYDLWLNFLHLAENLIRYSDTDSGVPVAFENDSVHVTVISRARAIMAEINVDESTQHAKMMGRIIRFLGTMMQRMEQVLHDCCKAYHFTEQLCHLLKDTCDPIILAEGCSTLLVILRNPQMYKQQGKIVAEEMQKFVPLLMFLGDQRYGEIYSCARHHDRGGKFEKVDPPNLVQLDDPLVCAAFVSIINLLAFFADETSQGHDDTRDMVNTELNKQDRDQKLLRLLVCENDDVRLSVMFCVGQVATEDIASEEMGMLVKCLSDTRNIAEGDTERVLAEVMKLLEKLVVSSGNEGVQFRQNYAEMAIAEAYLLLHQNALRDTYGREDEEDQKLLLSNATISFLRACSRRVPLRDHLRALHIEEKFPEILKKEEELHRPYAKDVAVEQTWTGRSHENLMKCLIGDGALSRSKKVLFRVLSRMADVMEGVPDSLDGRIEPYGLQDIAQKERGMWNEKLTLRQHLHLDDMELSDLQQQATDIRGRLDAILRHLTNFEIKTQQKAVLDLVRAETAWFDDAKTAGEQRMSAVKNEQERANMENASQAKTFDLQEAAEAEEELSGDKVLASAIHQFEDTADDASNTLFTLRPDQFENDETILFDSMTGGVLSKSSTYKTEYRINPAYPIAAYLRIIYAVIMVPPTEDCRREVLSHMRRQDIAARLCALVESVPYLTCNVAAKFLCVMRLVLDGRTSRKFEPPLDIFSLMAKYVQRIADGLLNLLKLTKDKCLDVREQTLCAEVASFMTALIASTPISVNWFPCPVTRRETITKCVDHMTPAVTIRLLIAMIIYDLQMDLGGGERAKIQRNFVQQAYDKVDMKDNATQALVELLVRSPAHKYDVLEVFSEAEVFQQQTVRPCYLAELLNDVTMHTYLLFVEEHLREKSGSGNSFRLARLRRVETADPKGRGTVQRLLAVTNQHIYLLAPPDKQPLYAHPDETMGRWQPSWEAVFPRPPTQVWKRDYKEVAAVYRCYGSQLMAIEWKPPGDGGSTRAGALPARLGITGQASAQSHTAPASEGRAGGNCGIGNSCKGSAKQAENQATPAKPSATSSELLIFHRSHCREMVARTLNRFSADKVDLRAKILSDVSIRREVLEHKEVNDPTGESVLAVSVALSEPKSTMLDWGAKMPKEPLLFVLTLKKVLVFNMSLNSWFPYRAEGHVELDDFRPKDLYEDTTTSSATGAGEAAAAPVAASPPKSSSKAPKTSVLTHNQHQDLPPKEIVFKTSAEAELVIRFRNNSVITIAFFDDTERESWRRALAYTLFKATEKVWTRDIPAVA